MRSRAGVSEALAATPSSFSPIGYIECAQRYRYEAARQASIAPDNEAWIQLNEGQDLRDALYGLSGFERIWVVYELHLNENWHPFVQPPRTYVGKLGVFATRSPHRPNRIGLSCVRLLGIEGNRLHIGQHDLLDATPVLDIKPYVPYADAFADARAGWVDSYEEEIFVLQITQRAQEQVDWVAAHAGWDLKNFLAVQLRSEPTQNERKRIEVYDDFYRIAFRTWRIDYRVDMETRQIAVFAVGSGYSAADLLEGSKDRYADKAVHRAFIAVFGAR
ncbi:MAG: tRNA (N6-threonylcarbamoyladenosine(37)-N6)-methyltransferase TrmO [Candidatus Latescibacterota bacterium]|jgi:tRNA-Thr(GGU) m(6)t(6)A37 methyltransferase TsaA